MVLSIGKLSKYITDEVKKCYSKHFGTVEDAVEFIRNNVMKQRKIFLKASRSMKFERIIEDLKK